MTTDTSGTDQQAELKQLRARVAELERELLVQAERTGRVVADAQRRTYWLDRWHLDLDALMRRRAVGVPLDTGFRAARKLRHLLQRVRRRLGSGT
jgi:hypothetical protein